MGWQRQQALVKKKQKSKNKQRKGFGKPAPKLKPRRFNDEGYDLLNP